MLIEKYGTLGSASCLCNLPRKKHLHLPFRGVMLFSLLLKLKGVNTFKLLDAQERTRRRPPGQENMSQVAEPCDMILSQGASIYSAAI
jgi:hypothetical protein